MRHVRPVKQIVRFKLPEPFTCAPFSHPPYNYAMRRRSVILACLLAAWPSTAQLPASGSLSESDRRSFLAEVDRIGKLLQSAPDPAAVTYQMARTWASGKQWSESIEWLRKAVGLKAGLDPSRDSVFAELRGTREFDALAAAVRESTPPVSHSSPAFVVPEGDLAPERVRRRIL